MKKHIWLCLSVSVSASLGIAYAKTVQAQRPILFLPVEHIAFPPLTLTQKLNALKAAGSKVTPPASGTIYTLTAQSPYSAPLDISLETIGGDLQAATSLNRIILHPYPLNTITAYINGAIPGHTYLVTFDIQAKTPMTATSFCGNTTVSSGAEPSSSYVPTGTISGPSQVTVVVLPGTNSAEVQLTGADHTSYGVLQEVTVEVL